MTVRTLLGDAYQEYRDRTGKRMATTGGDDIYSKRAPVVEGVFAVIKHIMGIRRFLLRGLDKVRIEWHWICAAYNLKRLLIMVPANDGPDKTSPRRRRGCAALKDCYGLVLWANLRTHVTSLRVRYTRHEVLYDIHTHTNV